MPMRAGGTPSPWNRGPVAVLYLVLLTVAIAGRPPGGMRFADRGWIGAVTLQRRGNLSLNKAAVEALGNPRFVELLFDPDERIVGLRKVDERTAHAYPVRKKQQQSESYLIAAKSFCDFYGIAAGEAQRFEPTMYGDVLGFPVDTGKMIPTRRRRPDTATRQPALAGV